MLGTLAIVECRNFADEVGLDKEMGRNNATETTAAVLLAFLRQPTWSQAALARVVGVSVPSLLRCLDELSRANTPLERSADHQHIYWSVPRGWLPGALELSAEQATLLLRLLLRHGSTPERDALLAHVMRQLPRPVPAFDRLPRARSAIDPVSAVRSVAATAKGKRRTG